LVEGRRPSGAESEFTSISFITLTASSDNRNVTVWRPSVRLSVPSFLLTLKERAAHTRRHSPGAAYDTASVHFGTTILVMNVVILKFVKKMKYTCTLLCMHACICVCMLMYVRAVCLKKLSTSVTR